MNSTLNCKGFFLFSLYRYQGTKKICLKMVKQKYYSMFPFSFLLLFSHNERLWNSKRLFLFFVNYLFIVIIIICSYIPFLNLIFSRRTRPCRLLKILIYQFIFLYNGKSLVYLHSTIYISKQTNIKVPQ